MIIRYPAHATLDASDLLWLLDEWLAQLAPTVSPYTLMGYRQKTDYFRRWWQTEGPPRSWQISKKDFRLFEIHLRSLPAKQSRQPLSWHTRNDALRRLREMLAWAQHEGHTRHDYSKWVPTAHGAPTPRLAASMDHLRQLLDTCRQSDQPTRNAALVALFIGAGIRRSEAANLQIHDLILHTDHSSLANIRGKRTAANPSGHRQIAFDATTGAYLHAYLTERNHCQGPLFIAADQHGLTAQGIYKVVKRIIRLAQLEQIITGPHDLRRAFATHFARLHPDQVHADLLRRQLGHANYRQTATYTLLDASDLIGRIHSPLSPTRRPEPVADSLNLSKTKRAKPGQG